VGEGWVGLACKPPIPHRHPNNPSPVGEGRGKGSK